MALAACAGRSGCGSRPLDVANLSPVAVEQLFAGSAAPEGWGADLLGQAGLPAGLPAGASTSVRVVGSATSAFRVVWSSGRAVELGGLDGCRITRVTVLDGGLRAE